MSDRIEPVDLHSATQSVAPTARVSPAATPSAAGAVQAPALPNVPHPELLHADLSPMAAPEAPHGEHVVSGAEPATMAMQLHHALDHLPPSAHGPRGGQIPDMPDANDLPEDVRRARNLRERAATMVAQGTPPLILDADRGHAVTPTLDEDGDGESRQRVDAMRRRPRRRGSR